MIPVLYSCHKCGVRNAEVTVRFRGDEDVVHWMQGAVVPEIARDHHQRSPHCQATEISETKIPLTPGEDRILGAPTKQ